MYQKILWILLNLKLFKLLIWLKNLVAYLEYLKILILFDYLWELILILVNIFFVIYFFIVKRLIKIIEIFLFYCKILRWLLLLLILLWSRVILFEHIILEIYLSLLLLIFFFFLKLLRIIINNRVSVSVTLAITTNNLFT